MCCVLISELINGPVYQLVQPDGVPACIFSAVPARTFVYPFRDGLPSSLAKKLDLPNTSFITNTYDSLARLTRTYLKTSGGTVLDKSEYVYSTGNQRTKLTRTDDSFLTFSYDNIGELLIARATNSGNAIITGETKGYAYDAGWNLARRTNNSSGGTTAFGVDSRNQLTTVDES
jgi:hypothetical protein